MSWPKGHQNLHISTGEVFTVPANNFPNYKNIIIEAGGTLLFGIEAFKGNAWQQLGCAGDFILKGNLVVRGSAIYIDNTYSWQGSDGTNWHVDFHQQAGGNGGGAFSTPQKPGGVPGIGQFGNGGGGAAPHGLGRNADSSHGGVGGMADGFGGTHWIVAPGGAGGFLATVENALPSNGGPGGDALSGGAFGGGAIGGGGGGGARGLHGGFLYLRVLGLFDAEGGLIDASGADGGAGGRGGNSEQHPPPKLRSTSSGGGGGGGAGGNGGLVVVSCRNQPKRGFENAAGGAFGPGGAPGSVSQFGRPGQPGQQGQPGLSGEIRYLLVP